MAYTLKGDNLCLEISLKVKNEKKYLVRYYSLMHPDMLPVVLTELSAELLRSYITGVTPKPPR